MNSSHLTVSESTARPARRPKARKGRGRTAKNGTAVHPPLAAAGSLTRTKALLLAALRVWELKHRISE